MSPLSNPLTHLIMKLGGKGSLPYPGGIGLDHTHDLVNGGWSKTGSYGHTPGCWMGGGHIGIGPKVHIQEGSLCTFKEHLVPTMDIVVGHLCGIPYIFL